MSLLGLYVYTTTCAVLFPDRFPRSPKEICARFPFAFALQNLWHNPNGNKTRKMDFLHFAVWGNQQSIQHDWKIPWRPIFTKHGAHTGALLKIYNKLLAANKSKGFRASAPAWVLWILTAESCFLAHRQLASGLLALHQDCTIPSLCSLLHIPLVNILADGKCLRVRWGFLICLPTSCLVWPFQ